jgi:hypothetical protein
VDSPIRQESPFFRKIPAALSTMSLSVDEMPAALLDYQRHRKRSDGVKGPDGVREDAQCCRAGWDAASANIGPAL